MFTSLLSVEAERCVLLENSFGVQCHLQFNVLVCVLDTKGKRRKKPMSVHCDCRVD